VGGSKSRASTEEANRVQYSTAKVGEVAGKRKRLVSAGRIVLERTDQDRISTGGKIKEGRSNAQEANTREGYRRSRIGGIIEKRPGKLGTPNPTRKTRPERGEKKTSPPRLGCPSSEKLGDEKFRGRLNDTGKWENWVKTRNDINRVERPLEAADAGKMKGNQRLRSPGSRQKETRREQSTRSKSARKGRRNSCFWEGYHGPRKEKKKDGVECERKNCLRTGN